MDEAERKRLKAKFFAMCEDAGYPEGSRPAPWNVGASKTHRTLDDAGLALDRSETMPAEGGFFSSSKDAK